VIGSIDNSTITFAIDNDLDFTSINLLKQLQRKYPNTVKLRSVAQSGNFENFNTNIFDLNLKELNREINTCFVLSSNIRLESAIINSRLRSKYLNETFNLVSFGLKSKNNIPSKIVNLNVKNILNLFEGKSSVFSKLLINNKNPLFILGESLKQRINNLESIKQVIKNYAPTALILFIEEKSNSKGLSLTGNVLPLSTIDLENSSNLFCVNLQDNYKTRSILNQYKGQVI
jgi:hypothetical protein